MSARIFDRLRLVRAFVFDVDGVLTDGRVHVWENGDQTRTMNVRDGFAIKRALNAGYQIGIITGGGSLGVESRLRGLGVRFIYSKINDKIAALNDFMDKNKLIRADILYMGDDIIDLPAMRLAGVVAAPENSVIEVLKEADYISPYQGGAGCVRDIIETTMKLQSTWKDLDESESFGV